MKKTFSYIALVAMACMLLPAACGKDATDDATGGAADTYWVDLGLPSGLLWAKCNIGSDSPEGYGDQCAWAETATKAVYEWNDYRYCNGGYDRLTKYCNNSSFGDNGFSDGRTTLEAADDTAALLFGSRARIPTDADWQELIGNTTSEWTTQSGVYGRRLTAPNGRSLFLPAAGLRYGTEHLDAETQGYYWSSSLYANIPYNAWCLHIDADTLDMMGGSRNYGRCIRAVKAVRK